MPGCPSPCTLTPEPVTGLSGVTALVSGDYTTCALLSGGTAQCWGDGQSGQLGNGAELQSSTPVAVSNLSGATALAMGTGLGCAVLSNGTIDCWGDIDLPLPDGGIVYDTDVPFPVYPYP